MATLAGFHRVTPCGGGSTKFADLSTSRFPALSPIASHVVYPAARRRRRAPRESPNPNQAFINYIINDYGQLILVKSKGNPIAPFEKIIGQGKPIHRCSPSGVQDIANERLYYGGWIPDPNWQWE